MLFYTREPRAKKLPERTETRGMEVLKRRKLHGHCYFVQRVIFELR